MAGWSYQVIHNILTNEKYYGDAVTGKTYITDPISKKVRKNMVQRPMVLTEYDNTFTHRLVERITVVDGETIRSKLRSVAMEIEQKLCGWQRKI